ncbi:MAG TPA: hypothetical protein DIU35_03325 [Candidatus Latescibacteria bacterium]|nr:hypothetical protein [Candidatus Latescibacterota bacterium]
MALNGAKTSDSQGMVGFQARDHTSCGQYENAGHIWQTEKAGQETCLLIANGTTRRFRSGIQKLRPLFPH